MIETAIMCLALNIYYEARSEPLAGKIAVSEVVLNRVADTRYPNTICEVVYEINVNLVGIVMVNLINLLIKKHLMMLR